MPQKDTDNHAKEYPNGQVPLKKLMPGLFSFFIVTSSYQIDFYQCILF